MPANLPPQYYEAERNFREAKSPDEKIAALEEMMAIMPKHKGTDHLRAELRTKIARLTEVAGKRSGGQRTSMSIPKEGAAQVAVVGPTNAGKSQLVCAVTKACPLVADYPFVTQVTTPGMMEYENIQLQLIDTPALAPQSIQWWLPPILRRADGLLVMVDLRTGPVAQVEDVRQHLARMRLSLFEAQTAADDGVPLTYKRALLVGNKLDVPGAEEGYRALQEKYGKLLPVAAISAREMKGLEEMKASLYQALAIIRVYTKEPGGKPDLLDPMIVPRGATLEEAITRLHKSFAARLKYARVWGSGKHDGIMVKRDHIMQESDIIELHL